jgi:zinc transporter ZupT
MTGASIGLIIEAVEFSYPKLLIGLILGVLFIGAIELILDKIQKSKRDTPIFLVNRESFFKNYKKAILIIIVMTAHSAAEGIGLGTSFGDTFKFGILMTIAIAIHNIPEGLAISAGLVAKGVSWWKAALWSIFTSLPQPLFAVPAFMFVTYFKQYLPTGLGFAAGAMLWVVFTDIVPESQENMEKEKSGTIIVFSMIAMLFLQYIL